MIRLEGLGLEVCGWLPSALLIGISLPFDEVDALTILLPPITENLFDLILVGFRIRFRKGLTSGTAHVSLQEACVEYRVYVHSSR